MRPGSTTPATTHRFASSAAPDTDALQFEAIVRHHWGVGRGRGVGLDLGVALGVAVGVTLGVAVGVAVGVGVGVGLGVGVGVMSDMEGAGT